ncbi:hypothetical protein KPH14_002721, partial [Odynerus spinipes]
TGTVEPVTEGHITEPTTVVTKEPSTHPATGTTEESSTGTVEPVTENHVTEPTTLLTNEPSTHRITATTLESVTETMVSVTEEHVTDTVTHVTHESSTDAITLSTEGSVSIAINTSTEHPSVVTIPSVTSERPLDDTKCRAPGFFPDPNDCTKFYRCVSAGYFGVFAKYEFVCPGGTIWDQDLSSCNHPWAVRHFSCKKNSVEQPQIDFGSSNMNVDGSNFCPIGKLGGEQIALICPTGFRKHPKYCNIFYQCTSESNLGVNIALFTCPRGMIYNEDRMQCVPGYMNPYFYKLSGCKNIDVNPMDNSVPILSVSSAQLCPNEGSYPYHPGCSNAYFKCTRDSKGLLQGYLLKCPRGYVFSALSGRCESAKYFPLCSSPDPYYQKDSSSNGLYITHHEIYYIGRKLP